jgi:hypothetical protein
MIDIYELINCILLVIIIFMFLVYIRKTKKYNQENATNNNTNNSNNNSDIINWANLKHFILGKRYKKAVEDPLTPPDRSVEERQLPMPNYYFQERTRGEPDDYQLVGLLYNNNVNKTYQLFGRRTYPGSYEWEYYIRGKDVGGLDYKFSIGLPNNQEIQDGTVLNIPIDSNPYNVTIYNYDYYRYIPNI